MPAAETNAMHLVVTPLIHCPDLEEPPAPLAGPDEEQALDPAIKVPEVPEQPPVSVEQPASAPEQHDEPRQEAATAPAVGPAEASGHEVIEPVTAAGTECLVRAEMPAAESEPMHLVVTPLIHCPDVEEPPAPLAAPDEEQAPEPAIKVPKVPEQPPVSVEQPTLATEQHPEPTQEPARATTVGPVDASGPVLFEPDRLLELSVSPEWRCQLLSPSQCTR
ncbi:Zinc metalloprotease ZmpB [Vulpes lagopus]